MVIHLVLPATIHTVKFINLNIVVVNTTLDTRLTVASSKYITVII